MKTRPMEVVAWLLLIVAPLVVYAVGMRMIPEGVTEVPLHWNGAGQVDRWGAPSEMLFLPLVFMGANVLLALVYLFAEKLSQMGLLNGTVKGGRTLMLFIGVFDVVLCAGIMAFAIRQALEALG
ncbi:DUF1648 domain-containing protein [Eggerthellaceae bacterium zg-1084]|uniref:DUF1648 domain-containing protein n=1 Tax=Berryella wangjianweii TaxID=2734634 RepID=UPI00155517BE|nr:DUF1648 domain-containing protein [Berryella wangjianweii]NPD30839.1 DUF1648 domain-containing protein [Berryella wangjianweii]NPD31706.1 DUF1648 domain-containing protein [Eggerthellaceae bacterium zg-997]